MLDTLQEGLFYDFGWIRQIASPWSGWNAASDIRNEYALDGVGLGLTWTPGSWCTVKGIVATRISANPGADRQGKDADGTKREPRFWLQASVNF